jgi:SAM-dependent methyltransferase
VKENTIGTNHKFHDKEYVLGWADKFVPTPERLELFNVILSELQRLIPENGRVVELGIGPGYLANHILEAMSAIEYIGIDFSYPMLEISGTRLSKHSSRVSYTQADLVKDDWGSKILTPVNAIVSTWALHDLGSQENVAIVYAKSATALGSQGVLLNGDFIKPDGTTHEFEAGRFQISRHLEMLRNVGFGDVECLILLEQEIESPTKAQNYACLKAIK